MTSSAETDSHSIAVAVLAAGHGTRMKSSVPKHLHPVGGTPIVEHVIRAGLAIEPDQMVVVVSEGMTDLPERLGMSGDFDAVVQVHPYGTAGAVRSALDVLQPTSWVVSLLGDSPLLTGETVQQLVEGATANRSRITILTCILPDANGYGRIERDPKGNAIRIVEAKNDLPEHRQGDTEINSGIMVLDGPWAREALARLEANAGTGEYQLTDILDLAVEETGPEDPWPISTVIGHPDVALGINDRRQQADADEVVRRRVRERLHKAGVTIVGGDTVFIDDTVEIAGDTTIMPFSVITGRTIIGPGCVVGPHAVLHDATLDEGVTVRSSTVTASYVGPHSDVGPYAHLRGNTRIGRGVHVGTSAEMKNSTIGDGTRVGHFSYLGDATLGERINVGAGTITANYDGTAKHPTTIGNDAFIGSDSVLIAPVTVGEGARTGAGAVVNHDVAEGSTVVGVPARPIASRHRQPVGTGSSDGTSG